MSNPYHLPNAHHAFVEREKITEYLLNPAHPDGAGKALFFAAHGFHREDWETLADGLRTLARTALVSKSMASPHGQKYIIDGRMLTPNGKTVMVRTVWIIDEGLDKPRLVTAYPTE